VRQTLAVRTAPEVAPAIKIRSQNLYVVTWRQLARKRTALFGLGLIILLVLTAILADVLAPHDPIETFVDALMAPPSAQFPLGTDMLGRDVLSRLIHGTRVSLYVGVLSLVLAIFVGIPLGVVSGFYGGLLDNCIMRVMDVILAFPIFLLAVVIMVILEPNVLNVVIALGIVRIPIYARLVRGSVLATKELQYVEAAQALAVPDVALVVSPYPPQLHGADYCNLDAQCWDLHHCGSLPELFRVGDTTAHPELGMGSQVKLVVGGDQPLDYLVSRIGDFSHGARIQSVWRWIARCA
jgi:ABC-type dipeptide/oligopeptide/nickel transport system permease subunit